MKVGDLVIEKAHNFVGFSPRIGVIVEVEPDGTQPSQLVGWVLWNGNFDWEIVYEQDIEIHNGQKLSVP